VIKHKKTTPACAGLRMNREWKGARGRCCKEITRRKGGYSLQREITGGKICYVRVWEEIINTKLDDSV